MIVAKKFQQNIIKLTPLTISVQNYVNQMPINPYLYHINSDFFLLVRLLLQIYICKNKLLCLIFSINNQNS